MTGDAGRIGVQPASLAPIGDLQHFGVAIKQTESGQLHVGALFRASDNHVKFLHLAWQDQLRCERMSASYWWGHCGMDSTNCFFLSLLSEKVSKRLAGKGVDWGWSYQGGVDSPIANDGGWSVERKPMTCATFIVALFVTLGYELVDFSTWPLREEDRNWAKRMLNSLRQTSSSHIDQLDEEIPNMTRIRPSEAAVAVMGVGGERPPLQFETIEPHSASLHRKLCGGDGA